MLVNTITFKLSDRHVEFSNFPFGKWFWIVVQGLHFAKFDVRFSGTNWRFGRFEAQYFQIRTNTSFEDKFFSEQNFYHTHTMAWVLVVHLMLWSKSCCQDRFCAHSNFHTEFEDANMVGTLYFKCSVGSATLRYHVTTLRIISLLWQNNSFLLTFSS